MIVGLARVCQSSSPAWYKRSSLEYASTRSRSGWLAPRQWQDRSGSTLISAKRSRTPVTCRADPTVSSVQRPTRRLSLAALTALIVAPPLLPREAQADTPGSGAEAVADAADPEEQRRVGEKALGALLQGREALVQVQQFPGSQGGLRARIRRKLPELSSALQDMTALLPAAIAVSERGAEGSEALVAATEEILIGASNAISLAGFVRDERPFEDSDIPAETFQSAIRAMDSVLAQVPEETIKAVQKNRCFKLVNQARDMEEMRITAASAPSCIYTSLYN